MQMMQNNANPGHRICAKMRRCLAGAQRLCSDRPPPASFPHTTQTHPRCSHRGRMGRSPQTPVRPAPPAPPAGRSSGCREEKGPNGHKSVFPVGR